MKSSTKDLLKRLKLTVGQETVFTGSTELGSSLCGEYARAIGDFNPLYSDTSVDSNLGLMSVVAPPTLICDTFQFYGVDINEDGYPLALFRESGRTPLRAGNRYEFYRGVRSTDVITLIRKVIDVWMKRGRSGELVFQEVEVTYYNQNRELLAKNIETLYYPSNHP